MSNLFYVVFYEKNCFLLRFYLIHSVSRETLCEIERFLFVFCLAIAQCPGGGGEEMQVFGLRIVTMHFGCVSALCACLWFVFFWISEPKMRLFCRFFEWIKLKTSLVRAQSVCYTRFLKQGALFFCLVLIVF